MSPTVCLIPRDSADPICAHTSAFLAKVIASASDLEVSFCSLPAELADPAETTIDEGYQRAIQSGEGRSYLNEAVSITVHSDPTGDVGVLLVGVGRGTRFHQYRDLVTPADPLSDAARLVLGGFRSHVIPAKHADQAKLLAADLRPDAIDFGIYLGRCLEVRGWSVGARKWWTSANELTDGRSFDASYNLAVSFISEGNVAAAERYLDRAEKATKDERQLMYVAFQRGRLALEAGRAGESCAHFDACLEKFPSSGMAHVMKAYALVAGGHRSAALTAIRRGLGLPKDETPEIGDAHEAAEGLLRELGI